MTSVGEALVRGLEARGVDHVFGIPGVHTLELYRGLEGSGIRHVTPRHEQGAGFMADGFGRVAGRPGVAFTISGPGLTNVLTPIGQARHDATPLLVVSASVAREARGRRLGVIHDLPDQAAATRALTRLTVTVDDPAALAGALEDAFDVLEGAQARPVPCTSRCRSTCSACPPRPPPHLPARCRRGRPTASSWRAPRRSSPAPSGPR